MRVLPSILPWECFHLLPNPRFPLQSPFLVYQGNMGSWQYGIEATTPLSASAMIDPAMDPCDRAILLCKQILAMLSGSVVQPEDADVDQKLADGCNNSTAAEERRCRPEAIEFTHDSEPAPSAIGYLSHTVRKTICVGWLQSTPTRSDGLVNHVRRADSVVCEGLIRTSNDMVLFLVTGLLQMRPPAPMCHCAGSGCSSLRRDSDQWGWPVRRSVLVRSVMQRNKPPTRRGLDASCCGFESRARQNGRWIHCSWLAVLGTNVGRSSEPLPTS
jgi:hypothetical protein